MARAVQLADPEGGVGAELSCTPSWNLRKYKMKQEESNNRWNENREKDIWLVIIRASPFSTGGNGGGVWL